MSSAAHEFYQCGHIPCSPDCEACGYCEYFQLPIPPLFMLLELCRLALHLEPPDFHPIIRTQSAQHLQKKFFFPHETGVSAHEGLELPCGEKAAVRASCKAPNFISVHSARKLPSLQQKVILPLVVQNPKMGAMITNRHCYLRNKSWF